LYKCAKSEINVSRRTAMLCEGGFNLVMALLNNRFLNRRIERLHDVLHTEREFFDLSLGRCKGCKHSQDEALWDLLYYSFHFRFTINFNVFIAKDLACLTCLAVSVSLNFLSGQ
jgi:hypothetical protein